jgi:hypothetical protein
LNRSHPPRRRYYKPRAEEDLADLNASDPDLAMIDTAVRALAAGRKSGYPVPLQSPFLSANKRLYQYQAGRYKLNYTLTKTELTVESVML